MPISYFGPFVAAAMTALAIYYIFRMLLTADAGGMTSTPRVHAAAQLTNTEADKPDSA